MRQDFLRFLVCPRCGSHPLHIEVFEMYSHDEVLNGVLLCETCDSWYPIKDCLLELLVEQLCYENDRVSFYEQFADRLRPLGILRPVENAQDRGSFSEQVKQQSHFDWYADNLKQSYSAYENTPFWKAADQIAFSSWRRQMTSDGYLLDLGCAQGRSTFKMMDLELNIMAFDISKALVAQAIKRYHKCNHKARALFFVADGSRLPLVDSSIDYLVIYGVLHHLPNPEITCREISRVLKPGGIYFGSENNQSIFRVLFDLIQRIFPLWHEEAGTEPLVSKKKLDRWFSGTSMDIHTTTSVFLPPHILNLVGDKFCWRLLTSSDRLARSIPFFRDNGGLILIHGLKK